MEEEGQEMGGMLGFELIQDNQVGTLLHQGFHVRLTTPLERSSATSGVPHVPPVPSQPLLILL